MSIIESIRRQAAPIHPEGYLFIGIFALASLVLFIIWKPLGWIGVILTLWCVYFFRDPVRVTPVRDGLVIAPADGKISSVALAVPPAELGLGSDAVPRVSIFMSVFDVHVNRAPLDGTLEYSRHQDGEYLDARDPECSILNEAQNLGFKSKWGPRFYVRQITGLIARRIVLGLKEGDAVKRGERFGMLKFGSRTELYFDNGFEVEWKVKVGDKVKGGGTVVATVKVASNSPKNPESEKAVTA